MLLCPILLLRCTPELPYLPPSSTTKYQCWSTKVHFFPLVLFLHHNASYPYKWRLNNSLPMDLPRSIKNEYFFPQHHFMKQITPQRCLTISPSILCSHSDVMPYPIITCMNCGGFTGLCKISSPVPGTLQHLVQHNNNIWQQHLIGINRWVMVSSCSILSKR